VPVVALEPKERALVEIEARRFVLLTPEPGVSFLVNAICPHRGGPLHLGRLDLEAGAVHCPWHERRVSLRHLQREALPLVRWRDHAVAVVPDEPDAVASAPVVRRCAELCPSR
jgi:nitrite reductase (NADH) small subunit